MRRHNAHDVHEMTLAQIINLPVLQSMMNDFYHLTHIGIGIIDIEGNILVATGWQDICTKFHRVHPETNKICQECDRALISGITPGTYKCYKCGNQIWDIVTPIMLGGRHVGNIFLGQFFFNDEKVDYDLFKAQAERYGFDQTDYLAALDKIPRWSHETVETVMAFYIKLANLISLLSFQNVQLAQTLRERDRLVNQLQFSESRHRTMFANVSDVIGIIHPWGVFKSITPNVNKIFGWQPEELIGRECWATMHPDDMERVQHEIYLLLEEEQPGLNTEFSFRCPDGNYRKIALTVVNLIHDPSIGGLLLNYHDITKRAKREDEILYLSFHDVLTGLFNRRFFEEEMKRLDAERQLPISVIMGDINGLKLINDIFGHLEGDKVLQAAGETLKKSCRADDIVARWGGDEFVILLPRTPLAVAKRLCRKIKQECSTARDKKPLHTSISLGCASKTKTGEDILQVIKNAEDLMYQNKLSESRDFRRSIVNSINQTLARKSHETSHHAERLKKLCRAMGSAMGMLKVSIDELELLAALHDIGIIAIDEQMLKKNQPLSQEEWEEMKRHPEIGYHIAKAAPELMHVADHILSHHEWWDGSGYPRGLRGKEIPLLSRILAIVDAYEAMTSQRPYRQALSHEQAIAEIRKVAGRQFDPDIVQVFLELVEEEEIAPGEN